MIMIRVFYKQTLISEFILEFSLCLCFAQFQFLAFVVNRLGNEVAHRLARHAWNVENIEMWWDCVPIHVSQAI